MARPGEGVPAPVTLGEIVCAISLAADLGLGQPMEHVLRACAMATRFADYLEVSKSERAATYWTALFVGAGCTGQSWEMSQLFGDDLELRAGTYRAAPTDWAQLRYFLGKAGPDRSVVGRALLRTDLLVKRMRPIEQSLISHCNISAQLALELGLGEVVISALRQAFARWDGKGLPRGVGGTDIALPMRICVLVDAAEVITREQGAEASQEIIKSARGTWFDPALVDAWQVAAAQCTPGDREDLWDVVVSSQPVERSAMRPDEVDRALELIADYADLKSPWFAGHSRGVAELAAEAGRAAQLSAADVTTLRRAALVHDIGRNGVPNSIWDKPGPLTPAEMERVQLHAYYTDRVLRRCPGLAHLAAIASSAHERGDGSGYPRAISGATIPALGRVLEAADAYHAMREDRPHRRALSADAAASELRKDVRGGSFNGAAVDAVLAAAGHVKRKRTVGPAGLSVREVDVLVLAARGLTNREIGTKLGVTPKTVGNFIERVYAKAGISSRAEAAMFAMKNGLISPEHL